MYERTIRTAGSPKVQVGVTSYRTDSVDGSVFMDILFDDLPPVCTNLSRDQVEEIVAALTDASAYAGRRD